MQNAAQLSAQTVIILAAGRHTQENIYLKEILFTPVCRHISSACQKAGIGRVTAISNRDEEALAKAIAVNGASCEVFTAAPASKESYSPVSSVIKAINSAVANRQGHILMLRGDIPLFDCEVIVKSFEHHTSSANAVTLLSSQCGDQDRGGAWFKADSLKAALKAAMSETPPERCSLSILPDIIYRAGGKIDSYFVPSPEFSCRTSSAKDIFTLTKLLNERIMERHMSRGVEFLSADGVLISCDAVIGQGTRILPGTIIKGKSIIGQSCELGPNTLISDTSVGDNTKINSSQCYSSEIADGVSIGPFCHIRPNSKISSRVHLGDFVEIKNSTLGEATHVSHLTYVGDSDVGERVNFGCGVVTVNYNGKTKARCTIGNDAFIGCNTNLVAPVTVGDGGYTAAGSTITEEVPPQAMAIARARQTNKPDYNKKLRG